jgi:hypothetical protein
MSREDLPGTVGTKVGQSQAPSPIKRFGGHKDCIQAYVDASKLPREARIHLPQVHFDEFVNYPTLVIPVLGIPASLRLSATKPFHFPSQSVIPSPLIF